jgi:dipeptidyl aminopeptidase/acylaminoacyl peptidase
VKPKLKRLLKFLAVLALGAFAALNFIACRQAWVMTHYSTGEARTEKPEALSVSEKIKVLFCGVNLPRPHSLLQSESLAPECRSLTIPGTNGIKLGAWYSPASTNKPLVLLFHGYGAEKTSMIPEARAFLDMGCSVLLVDFRGSGESSESYTTVGYREAEDVASAVNYAATNLPHRQLILYGGSMGAAAIVRAVAVRGVRPDAVIAEGVFDNMLNTVKHRFQAMGVPAFPSAQLLVFWGGVEGGFNAFANNPADYAAGIRCPILFLHGSGDPRAHLEDARRVFDAVPGSKQFREFPGLGHEASIVRFPTEWKSAVGQFLDAALKHAP